LDGILYDKGVTQIIQYPVGKLGMAVRDLAPILGLLESMWLIEWSRVASSEPDIDAFWRIDLLGGGAP
jgi:hypothetical protein